jgi:predicted Rossmann-fold nucleotide-binding protein
MRTIIAGSRTITEIETVAAAVAASGFEITEVVCGGARGVDLLGAQWALEHGVTVNSAFSAEWRDITTPGAVIKVTKQGRRYNAMAGFDRNQKMVDYAEALIAVWDGHSPGTRDVINRARARGLKVFIQVEA